MSESKVTPSSVAPSVECGTYQKLPVTIWACRFDDTAECLTTLSENGLDVVVDYANAEHPVLKIETLEGVMSANVGDFIIKGVAGEFYPCKPHVFSQTHMRVYGE